MRAEIIATGSELLTGGAVETNSVFLADGLLELGIETAFKSAVGDNEKDMEEIFRCALNRADVVVITGGLGPTEDDITMRVLARMLKKRLVLNEDALAAVKAAFAARGKEYHPSNDRQALVPSGARILRNSVGVAPGFLLTENEKLIAVLPGVPVEAEAMFRNELQPILSELSGAKIFFRKKVLHTIGLSESEVNELIGDLLKQKQPVMGLSAKHTGVDIRILTRERSRQRALVMLERTEAEVRKRLGDAVYGVDGQELEEIVGLLLKQRHLTLSVAESCTGGLLGGWITRVSGSSDYFDRGIVTYSNASKTELLGVSTELIKAHGAVSTEVAAAMARGVRELAKTDIGISITGIAGPGGGSHEKPVGLVYMGLAWEGGVKTAEYRFLGNREQVRLRSVAEALDMVRRHLIA